MHYCRKVFNIFMCILDTIQVTKYKTVRVIYTNIWSGNAHYRQDKRLNPTRLQDIRESRLASIHNASVLTAHTAD